MKRKNYLFFKPVMFLPVFVFALFQTGCKKEEKPVNSPPTCVITAPKNGQEIVKGEIVTLSAEAEDKDGEIREVRFYIDGVGMSSVTSFPYNYNWNTSDEAIDNHVIKATAFDNDGEKATDEITVSIVLPEPVADFTASPTEGTAPLTVNFTDQSTNSPVSWQWDFGDGATSTEQNPAHTYDNGGFYTVSLTVTNASGSDTMTKSDYIVVNNGVSTGTFTDPRDGKTYKTVTVGGKTWFAENLNYETDNSICYNQNPSNCAVYGRLYEWEDALTACPDGWHLSTDDEWKTLEMYLGMSQSQADNTGWRGSDEGKKLKSTEGWYNNGNGTDEIGFSALPGGYFDELLTSRFLGGYGFWWTSSGGSGFAWYRHLKINEDGICRKREINFYGYSVRCVKD